MLAVTLIPMQMTACDLSARSRIGKCVDRRRLFVEMRKNPMRESAYYLTALVYLLALSTGSVICL